MSFPDKPYASVSAFLDEYTEHLRVSLAGVSRKALIAAGALLEEAVRLDADIFVCGNGGSAAISNHFVCDHAKGVRVDTKLHPKIRSLSSDIEMLTAIANDLSYDEVFAHQLEGYARAGDVLVVVSSSGDSKNIVKALSWAQQNRMKTIAMTGFTGGQAREIADVSLHVDASNYGIVEDAHQSLMHILAQFIRQNHMAESLVESRYF